MENTRIIYKQTNGTIAIITPSPTCGRSVEEIAKKDVPSGMPYKIVNLSDLPSDRTFRNAWEISDAQLTDGVGE